MFQYHLPESPCTTESRTFVESNGSFKFRPQVGIQRYHAAVDIIRDKRWSKELQKIVDFGCSEMHFFRILRSADNISCILEVDIDKNILLFAHSRVKPLLADHLTERNLPLHVEVLAGSVTTADERLRNMDVVVAIELIEHLQLDIVDKAVQNIFGYIQPKLAIISTPNADFNVLFNLTTENGFRHPDHKFEWTREEFLTWATAICKQYPNYKVSLLGVGKPPHGSFQHGFVSQIAVFARVDLLGEPLVHFITTNDLPAETNPSVKYELIYEVDYPFTIDNRSRAERLEAAIINTIYNHRYEDKFYNHDRFIYQIPLSTFMWYIQKYNGTEGELREILKKHDYEVENNYVNLPAFDENIPCSRYEDCYDNDEDMYNDWFNEPTPDNDSATSVSGNLIQCDPDEVEENWDTETE